MEKRASAANTFSTIAAELIAKNKREGKADTTIAKKEWLLSLVKPSIGERPITAITAPEILAPLRKVESAGNYETARRLRAVVGQVFRYAIATARADLDPTSGLRGALTSPVVTHHAAIVDRKAFSGLIRAIWNYDGSPETRAALKLLTLLYPRPGELRRAEWPEFDLKRSVWTIPVARMKMRRDHRKPLPRLAVDILKELHTLTGNREYVFPSNLSMGKPISENTLNGALRRMGFSQKEATSHGFRSSASTLLNESGLWTPDAIEAELAHMGADAVRRAYHRGAHWAERIKMCEWWAKEIEKMAAA